MKKLFVPIRKVYEEFLASGRSGGNYGKGLKCMEVGQYQDAVKYFQRALEDSEKVDNPTMIPNDLAAIANAYFMLGDFDQAEVHAQKSLKLFKQIEHPGDVVKKRMQQVRYLLDLIETEKNEHLPKI